MGSFLFWRNGKGKSVSQGEQVYGPSTSVNVDFQSAMQVSAFWACVRILTETVAAMPLKCYRVGDDGSRTQTKDHDIFKLLNRRPNRYQTRIEFFESVMINLVTDGNSYCFKQKAGSRLVGLMPLPAGQVKTTLENDGSITYLYTDPNQKQTKYRESDIWHVKLFGNGIVGLSPLRYATTSLSTAIVQDSRNLKNSKNGGKVGGYVGTPDGVSLKKEQRDGIREELQSMVSGDADFLPVLEMGAKFVATTLTPSDVKLLESRRFSVEDLARFMGVPSVLINDTAGSTVWGSGIGQLVEGFYKLNLKPYLERIESSIKVHLMNPSDFDKYDIEFDFDSLLRADKASRVDANGKAINSGQLTPNEARASEGKPPKEGGDDIYLNGTLVKAGKERETMQNGSVQNEQI